MRVSSEGSGQSRESLVRSKSSACKRTMEGQVTLSPRVRTPSRVLWTEAWVSVLVGPAAPTAVR